MQRVIARAGGARAQSLQALLELHARRVSTGQQYGVDHAANSVLVTLIPSPPSSSTGQRGAAPLPGAVLHDPAGFGLTAHLLGGSVPAGHYGLPSNNTFVHNPNILNKMFAGDKPAEMPRQDVPPSHPQKPGVPSDAPTSPDEANPEIDRSDYSAPGTNPDVKPNKPEDYQPDPNKMPAPGETPAEAKHAVSQEAAGPLQMAFATDPMVASIVDATMLMHAARTSRLRRVPERHWVHVAPVEALLETPITTHLAQQDRPIGREGQQNHRPGMEEDHDLVPPETGGSGGGSPSSTPDKPSKPSKSEDHTAEERGANNEDDDILISPIKDHDSANPGGTPADVGPEQAGG